MANSFVNRVVRAARLDPQLYEEVEADRSALGQAVGVVVLSSLAAGIGGYQGRLGVFGGTVVALVGWYVWAYLAYWVGTRLFPESETRADHGELLRTVGFAAAPGIVRGVGVIDPLQWIAHLVAGVWTIAAMVVAVRQALDYKSTARAAGVCLVAWVVQGFAVALLLWLFGGAP
ncbi:YIP1 family protein [Deferrisoma palaeochoriense]